MMNSKDIPYLDSLTMMNELRGYLTREEELAFMQLLFSSSASIRGANYGLRRGDVEKILGIKNDDAAFDSFIGRLNQAVERYFKIVYDERRDRVVIMMRVSARDAKSTLSSEALAILLYIFYQQEVLGHTFTLEYQLLTDFGHEAINANHKLRANINQLKRVGALEDYEGSDEDAYELTTIGVHMFADSFLHRTVEFAQETKLNKEEVMKFFGRYNLRMKEDE